MSPSTERPPTVADVGEAAVLAEAGKLKPLIDSEWRLDQLGEAHTRQESQRAIGKLVYRV